MFPGRLLLIALAASLLLGAVPARAEDGEQGGPTPPRLSYLDGEVSFWRPGAEDWSPARVNTPLAEGDSLYTATGANAEVQIGSRAFVRFGQDTQLGIDSLEDAFLQLKLTNGHAALDLQSLPRGHRIEVDTPTAAITIDDEGYYRVIVGEAGTRLITRRGGRATVTPAGGTRTEIPDGTEAIIEGAERVRTQPAPDLDAWDRWNYERGDRRSQPARRYVPEDVYGGDDLDQYGSWRTEPSYGAVWYPRTVAVGWSPYSAGRWLWDPYYGWSWCDDAPWGWAPFHYGRWVSVNDFWGWAPGPIVATAYYAPALVAFFGPVAVSVGVPFVSWVPLGWGEPCHPWWGGYVGQPWWGGWGGPHVNITNVHHVNVYQNVHVNNGVVAVQREGFGHGRGQRVHLDRGEIRHLRPVNGRLDIQPRPASLVPGEGRGHRPPDAIRNRTVVSTREPRDPARRLAAEGLPVPAEGGGRQRRIVDPPTRQHARPAEAVRPRGFETPNRGGAPEPPRGGTTRVPRAPHEDGWRGNRPERAQPPPPRYQREGRPRNVGGAPEPPPPHRGANPNVYTAPEPRQAPRTIERRPPAGGWDSGQRVAPPSRGAVPERPRSQHDVIPQREAIPQREMPSPPGVPVAPSQPAPAPLPSGGGAPNMAPRPHGGGGGGGTSGPRMQRFAPPPAPRTVGYARPAQRMASVRPQAQARWAPARIERPSSGGGRVYESGRTQGRRRGNRG